MHTVARIVNIDLPWSVFSKEGLQNLSDYIVIVLCSWI